MSSRSSSGVSAPSRRSRTSIKVQPSGGNVFADMGMPNAGELLFKADLAIAISNALERRKLSQARAAALIGIDQPKVSALTNGDTRGFSVDRLLKILTLLGQDVDIRVQASKGARGRVRVAA